MYITINKEKKKGRKYYRNFCFVMTKRILLNQFFSLLRLFELVNFDAYTLICCVRSHNSQSISLLSVLTNLMIMLITKTMPCPVIPQGCSNTAFKFTDIINTASLDQH